MLRVVDKAGKPGVGLLSPAHFRCAGLGADRQVPELGLPILLATLLRIISFSCRQVSSP